MLFSLVTATLVATMVPAAYATEVNPVGKTLQLLSDLQAKIIAEGEEATKTYNAFAEFCEDRSKTLGSEIKTGKAEMMHIKATIEAETATMASLETKVEELAASTATSEADLKAATQIRSKEAADFASEEKMMLETIDALERAISTLEREMQKGGASMLQLKNAGNIAHVLSMLVEASAVTSADAQQLAAFVQSSQQAEDSDGEVSLGAPDAAAYEGHSQGVITTLEDLLDKAQSQLAEARNKETTNLHNFELLKQSLSDEIKYSSKELAEAKQKIAGSGEKKATAEGDLEVTSGELKEDTKTLAELHHDCMAKAQDYEAETQDRTVELKAIAEARKVIEEQTGAAEKLTYGPSQVAFLQLSRAGAAAGVRSAGFKAVRLVRELARTQHSPALAQLAARMASATHVGQSGGEDPFAKVKALISDMLEKLQDQAEADASHKAYCDKEMAEATERKEDKSTKIEQLSTKIDQMTSRAAELKAQIADLETGLSQLTGAQAEMDKLRQKEKDEFTKNKSDMEAGIQGVKVALKVLRDYYAQGSEAQRSPSSGASSSLLGLLEVIESDFSKGLTEMVAAEESAEAAYEKETKENAVEKATKEKDVEYKTKEAASLEKDAAEASNDRSVEQTELDAVLESLRTLEKQCVAQPMSFEERQKRFEKELAGLKEALSILDGEAVLLQRGERHALRGVRPHHGSH